MTSSLFELHFTRVDAFLEEVRLDTEDDVIQAGIVRVAVVSGHAPGKAPPAVAQSWYVESSYVSGRQQLVKLSLYAGWKWTRAVRDEQERKHNEKIDLEIRELLLKIQAGLQKVPNIRLRGGSLVEAHDIWQPEPNAQITSPDELVCATCQEAIYFANEEWRHQQSKLAAVYEAKVCPACNDTREVPFRPGRRRVCPRCLLGQPKDLHHLADPEKAGRRA